MRFFKPLLLGRCKYCPSLNSLRTLLATPGAPTRSYNVQVIDILYRHRTLTGARAERNEYILLHEFHRLKYICPDKYWTKQDSVAKAKAEVEEFEDGDGVGKTVKGKNTKSKDKYKGGLVFDPKRGLWDKYILVMDFNSLYPSIIQEFNIDFTTVDKVPDEVSVILPRHDSVIMTSIGGHTRRAGSSTYPRRSASPYRHPSQPAATGQGPNEGSNCHSRSANAGV